MPRVRPFVLSRRHIDGGRRTFDRIAGLILDDPADRRAAFEVKLPRAWQYVVVPPQANGHEIRLAGGDLEEPGVDVRRILDRPRAVLPGREGTLVVRPVGTGPPIGDGHALDRQAGLRCNGAERQPPSRFRIRGRCRVGGFWRRCSLLGTRETEAADEHQEHGHHEKRDADGFR